jgi:hypothetical protein
MFARCIITTTTTAIDRKTFNRHDSLGSLAFSPPLIQFTTSKRCPFMLLLAAFMPTTTLT